MSFAFQQDGECGPIVVADPSRERRLFFEHAFGCLGYASLCSAGGAEAIRLIREHESPLLVAHTAVLGASATLTLVADGDSWISRHTKVLWYDERSYPPSHAVRDHTTTFVMCGENPATVVSAAQSLLKAGNRVNRDSYDLLLTLMLLDAELSDLSEEHPW